MLFPKLPKQARLSIAVLVVCFFLAFLMIVSKSSVKKAELEAPLTLVEVITAKKGDVQANVVAFGTVQGNRNVNVRPEVSGTVVEQSKNLVIGGFLKKGELMLQIDPRNYEIAAEQEKAAVEKAEFELQVEMGKQVVAEREWSLLNPSIDIATEIGEELALRKPHLREKKSALEAAKSKYSKSILDLERTRLYSPFNAVVIEEAVEPGEYITPESTVAKLVSTDEFRIQVSVPYYQLSWVTLPTSKEDPGSEVTVIQELGGRREIKREARLLRLLGDIDPTSRMARLLLAVEDPLGINHPEHRAQPLLIGTYVRVEIKGPKLDDVFAIPRLALHEGDKVWINTPENKLEIRPVNVLLRQEDTVIIDKGLRENDEIIISRLPLAIPGTSLKTIEENGNITP